MSRLVDLVALRYRLLWAYVRNSPAGIAFSAIALFLLGIVLLLITVAGMGGMAMAASLDQVEVFAQLTLGVMFLNALVASLLLGFGTKEAFSDVTLRRYPLSRVERLTVRHVLGMLEPLWLVTLATYLGAAAGAAALGPARVWIAVPVAVLLLAITHLLARLALAVGERLAATAAGSVLLMLLQVVFFIPLVLTRSSAGSAWQDAALAALAWTPPFAAAAVLADTRVVISLTLLVAWFAAIAGSLLFLETRPPLAARGTSRSAARWDTLSDRVAALAPGKWEPLLGRGLRYYLRSPRVRVNLLTVLPLMAFVAFSRSPRRGPIDLFGQALLFGGITVPLLSTALSANVFGYEASGFRRLLLSPLTPVTMLRGGVLAPLLIGTGYALVAVTAWLVFAPVRADGAMLVMLLAHMLTGMVLFHALAVVSSVLSVKRVSYGQKFRDDMSTGGYVVMLATMVALIAVPILLRVTLMPGPLTRYWWVPVLALLLSVGVYEWMLRVAARILRRRRERLVALVEGRS